MSWVTELIILMPVLVFYIAPGFLFINCFMWSSDRKFKTVSVQIVSSIVASYLLEIVFRWFVAEERFSPSGYIITLSILCAILGLFCGRIIGRPFFLDILKKFKIYKSTNVHIWDDMLPDSGWVAVFDEVAKVYYCGMFSYSDVQKDKTIIAISAYYILDNRYRVIKSYGDDVDRYFLIDTSKYKHIIVSKKDPFDKTEEV